MALPYILSNIKYTNRSNKINIIENISITNTVNTVNTVIHKNPQYNTNFYIIHDVKDTFNENTFLNYMLKSFPNTIHINDIRVFNANDNIFIVNTHIEIEQLIKISNNHNVYIYPIIEKLKDLQYINLLKSSHVVISPNKYISQLLRKYKIFNYIETVLPDIILPPTFNNVNVLYRKTEQILYITDSTEPIICIPNLYIYKPNSSSDLLTKIEEIKPSFIIYNNELLNVHDYYLNIILTSNVPLIIKTNNNQIKKRLINYGLYKKKYITITTKLTNQMISDYKNIIKKNIISFEEFNPLSTLNSIHIPELFYYIYLYEVNHCKNIMKEINKWILPFAVYFPQHHEIPENNVNYYKGMTDIKNLHLCITKHNKKFDFPDVKSLGLDNEMNYDQTNIKLVNEQIEIARNNCIRGFAVYFYWFETNNVTGKNKLMDKCYDLFFRENINVSNKPPFHVFFDWASENWTNNIAFNSKKDVKIENSYSKTSIDNVTETLILYFKHSNYYKLNNKPVFSFNHSFLMSKEMFDYFHNLLNKRCIMEGFNGIHIIINSRDNKEGFPMFRHQPNSDKGSFKTHNYKTLMTYNNVPNMVNTLAYGFNNHARLLYTPYTTTEMFGNDIESQIYVTNYMTQLYKKKSKNIYKLMRINAWNEWGEDMYIEPSIIKGNFYLNIMRNSYLKLIYQSSFKHTYSNIQDIVYKPCSNMYNYIMEDNKIIIEYVKISKDIPKRKPNVYIYNKPILYTESEEQDFLIIFYERTLILGNWENYANDIYTTYDEGIKIFLKSLKSFNGKIILSIHDTHNYTFKNNFKGFFEFCNYYNINAIITKYSSNFESDIISYCNLPVFTIPHLIRNDVFYKQPDVKKTIDILMYGSIGECNDFRKRLHTILSQNKDLNIVIIPNNPQYYTKDKICDLLNKSYIGITTSSSYNYFVMKYMEIALCGCVIAGNMPKQGHIYFNKSDYISLEKTMTDEQIIDILTKYLENKEILYKMINNQYERIKYLQTVYYKSYYEQVCNKLNI
jgi:hypothetical protein